MVGELNPKNTKAESFMLRVSHSLLGEAELSLHLSERSGRQTGSTYSDKGSRLCE